MTGVLRINGRSVEEGTPLRSLVYGEGLFETFRWKSRLPAYYERHIDRMREGARVLGLPFRKEEKIKDDIEKALWDSSISDAYVKIALLSEGSPDFYKEPSGGSLLIVVRPYQPPNESIRAKVSSCRRSSSSPILRIKSLNYLENILAKREALAAGCDEAIFLNERSELAEGTVTNIFFIKGKVIYTPSVECGLLAGIIRGVILECGHEFGFEVREGRHILEDLKDSEGVFLTNSLIGAVRLSSIDGINLPHDCGAFCKLADGVRIKLGW